MTALSRRAFLLGSMTLTPTFTTLRSAASTLRVVCLDYGLAQTLIEIGVPPVGLIDTPSWSDWAVEPPLPLGIANMGSAHEINMELLQLLKPDLILSTPYLEWVRPQLELIAPVKSFPIHALGTSPYPNIVAATLELGRLLGRSVEAEALVERTENELEAAKGQAQQLGKLAVMTFIDPRNIRFYGPGGNFQDVLDRLGLENAWTRPANEWGFSDAGMADLFEVGENWLFYMDPVPADVLTALPGSPLWQSMPFVQKGRARRMESVLMFGTLPSMTRLARLLVKATT
ncbi:MAG: iron-siderophore ABC transporter substrate-binding protein [Phyllobacterium sp.]|uniref:iron-siderophore ABC transporter substrate-binding protein n=1 Tax=Phyllobacterium sp. TaxID=1871046 RepID=UPI0030F2F5E1